MRWRMYFFVLAACQLLMPYMVLTQYNRRGYLGFGGEWFITFFALIAAEALRKLTNIKLH